MPNYHQQTELALEAWLIMMTYLRASAMVELAFRGFAHALVALLGHRRCIDVGVDFYRKRADRLTAAVLGSMRTVSANELLGTPLACYAVSLGYLGRTAEAIICFEDALTTGADPFFANYEYAVLLARSAGENSGTSRRAAEHFQRACEAARSDNDRRGTAWCLVGLAMFESPEKAESLYREALLEQPDLYEALYGLGVVAGKREQWNDAVYYYGAALRQQESSADAHYELANALCIVGDYRRAEAHFSSALRLGVDEPERALYGIAFCAWNSHRVKKALRYARRALSKNPSYQNARVLMEEVGKQS